MVAAGFLLWCGFQQLVSAVTGWSIGHTVGILTANRTFYLLESDGTYIEFPDEFTAKKIALNLAKEFSPDPKKVTFSYKNITETDLANYTKSDRWNPTLRLAGGDNADENTRVFCQEIEYLEYAKRYWINTVFLGNLMNPSIVKWQGKYLILARANYILKIVTLHWLKDDLSGVDVGSSYFGFREGSQVQIPGEGGNQEDVRGLALQNGSLLIYYGATTGVSSTLVYALLSVVDGVIISSGPTSMIHETQQMSFEKNWVPFEYHQEVYWAKFLNPPAIIKEYDPWVRFNDDGRIRAHLYTVYGINQSLPEDVQQRMAQLPWQADKYGSMRGGSPALLVRGVYLSFFHTQTVVHQSEAWRKTYFMGAIAMCSRPPFNVVKSSRVPIMHFGDPFYTDHWLFNNIDYVVFPAGFILSDDEKYLYLTFGYQDKRGYLITLEVDALMASLHFHSECLPDTGNLTNIREAFPSPGVNTGQRRLR